MNKLKLIAIDIAKNVFHLVVFGESGKYETRKKLNRDHLIRFIAKYPKCKIAMEACGSSHHWARRFQEFGHQVALYPPQHVKAYLRGQKNDYNDATAIAETALHGHVRTVPIKSVEQQDEQAFHRIRKQLVQSKGDLIRQTRGLLTEYGIVIPKGIHKAKEAIFEILGDAENGLTDKFRVMLDRQYERILALDSEIQKYEKELKQRVKADEDCQRLMDVPGFGVVNSSVMKHWMGDGKQFKRGRDASSALGVVPRQHSSGDKNRLLGITKRGDKELRSLVIHGARSVVSNIKDKTDQLSMWIRNLVDKRGFNKAVVAYANKMIRMAWVIIAKKESYQSDYLAKTNQSDCMPLMS